MKNLYNKSIFAILIFVCLLSTAKLAAQFTRLYGASTNESFTKVIQNGTNYYCLGRWLDPATNQSKATITKMNSTGQHISTLALNIASEFTDAVLTPSGDLIVVGYTAPLNSSSQSIMGKFTTGGTGSFSFVRSYDVPGRDFFNRIAKSPLGGNFPYYIVGAQNDPSNPSATWDDVVLLNVNETGGINWKRKFTSNEDDEFFRDLEILANGDLIIAGVSGNRGVIVRLDANGITINAGTPDNLIFSYTDISQLGNSGFYAVGETSPNFIPYIIRYDNDFLPQWHFSITGLTDINQVWNNPANGRIFVTGTGVFNGKSRAVLIRLFEVTSSNVLIEWVRFLDNGETSYSGGSYWFLSPNQIGFTDGRVPTLNGFGNTDAFLHLNNMELLSCMTKNVNLSLQARSHIYNSPEIISTFFDIPRGVNILSSSLNWDSQDACKLPCNAVFTYQNTNNCGNIQFNNQSTGALPLSYAWTFGDPSSGTSNTSTSANPTHQYRLCDTYNVCLIITANDQCRDTFCQTVTFNDNIKPVITCPPNLTMSCNGNTNPTATGTATATDNCMNTAPLLISYSDVTSGNIPCDGTIGRTWTATDACGNASNCLQLINIKDNVPPVIVCPTGLTLQCNANTNPALTGIASATDNCTPTASINISFTDHQTGNISCNEIIRRTWSATDACKNISTCVQVIRINDTTRPTIYCPADRVLQCNILNPPPTGFATATDNCALTSNITLSSLDVLTGQAPCNRTITRTWTAQDDCKNKATCVQIIKMVDTIPPDISCPRFPTVNTNPGLCYFTGTYPSAVATDSCDSNPTIVCSLITPTSSILITPNTQYPKGINTITCYAIDLCGNQSKNCTFTLTVQDKEAPEISCPVSISVLGTYNNAGQCKAVVNNIPPIVSDNCPMTTVAYTFTGATTGQGIADASGSTFMFGTTTVQYVATDMAGNQDTCKFNVKVFCEDTCCDDMQNNIANGHFLGQATGNLTPSSLPWYAAYLTPQIGTGDSCETPRVGQMWGNSVVGEVMGQTMPGLFKNGWTYRISFCAKFININNLPPNLQHGWFNLEAENGPYTGNGATIGQSPILNQHDVWSHVCLPDWKPTADYNSLFINFQNSSTTNHGDSVSWGRIDDICIQVVDSGCCTDSSQFASLINQGFTIVQTNCKVTVSAPQFDTCYFFSSPPSLDGSLVPQIITNANDMWMYNFTQSGIHQVCVTVFDDCNSRQMCTRFEVECDTCYCGSFSNISARLTGGAQNQSITCGDTIPLNCPQVFQLGGDFNCKGNDCDTTTKLDWKLEGPINTSGSISINTGFTLPLTASAFAASGLYTLTLTGYCDGKECPPCIIYFNATACDSTWACPCDNMTFNSELVRNGHFSLGNDGSFSNDYTYYNAGTSTSIGGYSVVTNAQVPLANSQWACNDHTTGTGQFLIVDGASNSGGIAWEQMIPGSDSGSFNLCFYANNLVIPAKDYEDPIIGVFINGVQVIPNFTISEIPDLWIPFNVTWVGKLPAKIEIHTQTSAVVGNDFAIDDISFTKCSSYDTSPCDSLNTGLVGYFPFVNNVDDASPTLGHGNLIGNPVPNLTFGKDGVANSAYHFNGSGQYIQAGFTDRNTTNQVTVMAWVKTTSKNPQWIAGKYEFNQDRGYGLTIGNNLNGSSGYVAFGGRDGTQTYHTSGFSKDSVNDGQWHCITGVAGQGYWKVYIDGILQSSTVGSSNNIASGPTIPFTIGAFTGTNPGTPLLMHGDIDDVKIYNRVISPTEIECLCAGSEEFGVCRCGAFSNLFYRIGGAQNQNLECSKTFTLTCPKVFQFGGEFACQGNDCDSTTKVEWTINGPIAGGGTVLANQGFTLPLNAQSFSLDGLYTLTLTGYCDGKPCPPCIINFEVTGCSPCCKDSIAFYNAVANFQTNSALGNCTIIANGTGLDSCKQVTWTWGDGNTTGPVANASPVSHIYSGTGTYNVCYIIEELDDDGEVCWSHKKCDSIFIACGDCDSVSLYVIPSGQNGDTCCYKVFINNINGPLITNINISAPTPVNFIGANPAPGWQVGPGPSLLQWALASGGTVPSGNNIQMGTFCLKASGEFPQNFTVQFLEFVGPNKFNLHCVDTLRTECVADSCVCGSFIDLSARINVGQQNIAIECGKSYLLDCPPVFQFGGDFICHGNDCDSVTKVEWNINGPIGGGGTVLASPGFNLPLTAASFSLPGLYTLTLVGYCDGKPCPPCIIYFESKGCKGCCRDSTTFNNVVTNFQTNGALGDCSIFVNGTGLDSCKQVTWYWGDGNSTGPVGNATSLTHTYIGGTGTYNVCYLIEELDANGKVCWSKKVCDSVFIICDPCCEESQNSIANGSFINQPAGNLLPTSSPWYAANLTPQIGTGDSCNTPRTAQMWGNSAVGEVMGQTTPGLFKSGWTYRIEFCAKFININNLPPNLRHGWFNLEAENGAYTGNGALIGQSPVLTQHNVWTNVCLPYWTPTADFDGLFINFQNTSTTNHGDSVSWGRIDDICIQVVDSGCCADSITFTNLVNQGFTINKTNCKVTVTAPQFDSCYYFGTPPMLDGEIGLQVITDPSGSWMYTFTQSGIHQICVTVFDDCNRKQMCTRFEVKCDTCECAGADHLSFGGHDFVIPTTCNSDKIVEIPCDANGQPFYFHGNVLCKGDSCLEDNFSWIIKDSTGKNIIGGFDPVHLINPNTGHFDIINLNAALFTPGMVYTITVTWYCDGKKCTCDIKFRIKDCDCKCGKFENVFLRPIQGAQSIPVKCDGDAPTVPCPAPGKPFTISGQFTCAGDDCPTNTQVDWILFDPLGYKVDSGIIYANNAWSLNLNAHHFGKAGTYTLLLSGHCGSKLCTCKIKFTFREPCPCDDCVCGKFSNMFIRSGQGPSQAVSCEQDTSLGNERDINTSCETCFAFCNKCIVVNGGKYCVCVQEENRTKSGVVVPCPPNGLDLVLTGQLECKGKDCSKTTFMDWILLDPDGLVIASMNNIIASPSFSVNISPLLLTQTDDYTLLLISHCGTQECICKIKFRMDKPCPDKCECDKFSIFSSISRGPVLSKNCGDTIYVPDGLKLFFAAAFNCKGICPPYPPIVSWSLLGPIGFKPHSGNASATPNILLGIDETIFTLPGIYTLTLIGHCGNTECKCTITFIKQNDCCKDQEIFEQTVLSAIQVTSDPSKCKATVTIGKLPACDYIDKINWGDGTSSVGPFITGDIPMHTYSTGGTYFISIIAVEEDPNMAMYCFVKLIKQTVSIKCGVCPHDTIAFSNIVRNYKPKIVVDKCDVTITNFLSGENTKITWLWGDGSDPCPPVCKPGQDSIRHRYAKTGKYNLCHKIQSIDESGQGCRESIVCQEINITCDSGESFNNDNDQKIFKTKSSVNDVGVRVYPNPNTGLFLVDLIAPASPGTRLQVVALTGQVLTEKIADLNKSIQTINVQTLPSGLYFIQIHVGGNLIKVEKFIKQ